MCIISISYLAERENYLIMIIKSGTVVFHAQIFFSCIFDYLYLMKKYKLLGGGHFLCRVGGGVEFGVLHNFFVPPLVFWNYFCTPQQQALKFSYPPPIPKEILEKIWNALPLPWLKQMLIFQPLESSKIALFASPWLKKISKF